jgi:hypothetical protein
MLVHLMSKHLISHLTFPPLAIQSLSRPNETPQQLFHADGKKSSE